MSDGVYGVWMTSPEGHGWVGADGGGCFSGTFEEADLFASEMRRRWPVNTDYSVRPGGSPGLTMDGFVLASELFACSIRDQIEPIAVDLAQSRGLSMGEVRQKVLSVEMTRACNAATLENAKGLAQQIVDWRKAVGR